MIELQALVPGLEGQTNYPEKPQDVMARGVSAVPACSPGNCLFRFKGGGGQHWKAAGKGPGLQHAGSTSPWRLMLCRELATPAAACGWSECCPRKHASRSGHHAACCVVHVLCGLPLSLVPLCCLFGCPLQVFSQMNLAPSLLSSCSCMAGNPAPWQLQVFSLMNLAYAKHEIISDYITAGLMWFETG